MPRILVMIAVLLTVSSSTGEKETFKSDGNVKEVVVKEKTDNPHYPDVLTSLGLDVSTSRLALVETRSKFKELRMPIMLKEQLSPAESERIERAKLSVSKLTKCLLAEESSDCILLAHPCVKTFRRMATKASGKTGGASLGELSCPVVLPSDMSVSQSLAIAERTLGAETYFEWGSGSSTETLAPLALRSYTAEHYQPWCDCLRSRPLAKCLAQQEIDPWNTDSPPTKRRTPPISSGNTLVSNAASAADTLSTTTSYLGDDRNTSSSDFFQSPQRIQCISNNLNLRSYGRLQQNGENNTHKNIADAHRAYVHAIDATGELHFDVILIDGRAHLSCALKALGYTTNSSTIFVSDFPRKYGKGIFRYYDLERTIGRDGEDCSTQEHGRCIGQLRPKPEFTGNHEVHTSFLSQNRNFLRSPVNF